MSGLVLEYKGRAQIYRILSSMVSMDTCRLILSSLHGSGQTRKVPTYSLGCRFTDEQHLLYLTLLGAIPDLNVSLVP